MKRLPAIDYTRHPAYAAQAVSGDTVRSTLEAFDPILFRKLSLLRESEDVFRSRVTSHRDSIVATIARDGAVAMSISAKDLDAVRAASARFETELRERINGKRRIRLRFRETQFLVHSDTEAVSGFEGLHAALLKALRRSGALKVAEAYFGGQKASLARTVYRINVESQPFYNNLFGDPSNRHSYTGQAGTLILFEGVHRGGDVRKGERIAIIFGLRMEQRQ